MCAYPRSRPAKRLWRKTEEHSFYTEAKDFTQTMPSTGAAALSAEERFSQTKSDYTSKDIQVLEGIQAIRHRPAMYIGSTGTSGLVHLIWEALDNAVDEAVAGYGTQIWVDVDREGIVR